MSETQSQTEQLESAAPSKRSSRKSILALSVFALGLNATAAVYTLSPSDFALPNVGSLAELLPHQKASDPIPDPVVAALKDIQSAQQQHVASLRENSSFVQQNTALLQQDSTTLASLRESITDERAASRSGSPKVCRRTICLVPRAVTGTTSSGASAERENNSSVIRSRPVTWRPRWVWST